jgi:hypothetical protein
MEETRCAHPVSHLPYWELSQHKGALLSSMYLGDYYHYYYSPLFSGDLSCRPKGNAPTLFLLA